MRMRAASLLTMLAIVFATASVGGCGSCSVSCGVSEHPVAPRVETATLVAEHDDDRFEFALADGSHVTVVVFGPTRVLHKGSRYVVPMSKDDGEFLASLPSDCGNCGAATITNADGSPIDQSLFRFPFVKAALGFIALFVVAIAIWSLVRRRGARMEAT